MDPRCRNTTVNTEESTVNTGGDAVNTGEVAVNTGGDAVNTGVNKKLIIWAAPRSISTAFFRALIELPNTKPLLEPYSKAFYFGEERISSRYSADDVKKGNLYKDILAEYGERPAEHETVIAKDMAYYLAGRLTTTEYLPRGYTHTFLIRDPRRAIYSLYKLSIDKEKTGWSHFDRAETGYTELYELYQLVTTQLQSDPVVVDADDLLQNPQGVLTAYCTATGLPFSPNMLNWGSAKEIGIFRDWNPWFEGVLNTSGLQARTPSSNKLFADEDLPAEVAEAIAVAEPIYQKMREKRLKIPASSALRDSSK